MSGVETVAVSDDEELPGLAGNGDALALPLTDDLAFELREGSHHVEEESRHWARVGGEGQGLLRELDGHPASRKVLHDPPKVHKVARQAVHGVHVEGVALA